MRFDSTVNQSGGATGIEAPQAVMDYLGGGKRYPVVVTVGSHTYRTTVTWYKGAYMIPLSKDHREAAGVAGGEAVTVDIELDDAPRVEAIPAGLEELLDDGDREFFSSLPPSAQKAFTVWIGDAKKPETRAKRVESAAGLLRERKRR